ncbi:Glutamate receptor, ionotropic kainate 1 [Operophtera brumata]|uniref:Glutamate receptor, ionotropic kainate 1 n=1 Tax=Operophtera brumata TaxID=104452 RepID=A0A0L7KSH4_OPEBR|nr:Glutamate receptor, ionotropic kainate 1 [Operophtera brumata]
MQLIDEECRTLKYDREVSDLLQSSSTGLPILCQQFWVEVGKISNSDGMLKYKNITSFSAVFTEEARGGSSELAFKYAVYRINKEKSLLPNSTLVYDIQYTPERDSFKTYKKACAQIKSGAVALFSGEGVTLGATLGALCRSLRAPHMLAAPAPAALHSTNSTFTVNLYPPRELMVKAFSDLIGYLNWTRMGVIYEDYGYGELNMLDLGDGRDMYAVRVSDAEEYRRALALIKAQRIGNIIVDTDPTKMRQLGRALQLMRLSGGEGGGTVLAGHWTPGEGLAITDPAAYKRDPPPNVTLTVVTVEVSA